MAINQQLCAVLRAVGHADVGGLRVDERAQHASSSAASADQQDTLAAQADPGVLFDVVDQPQAIGVVGLDVSVREGQDVAGLGQQAALAGVRRQRRGFEFKGNGDVAAVSTLVNEGLHAVGKVV